MENKQKTRKVIQVGVWEEGRPSVEEKGENLNILGYMETM
jgi:hypothetical protein